MKLRYLRSAEKLFILVHSLVLVKYYSNKDNPSLSKTRRSCGKQSYDFGKSVSIVRIKHNL